MELFRDYKQYLLIILITVVLGYFLGITVSTVVDYRIKDTVINLPRPKNKIMLQVDDKVLGKRILKKRNVNTIELEKKPLKIVTNDDIKKTKKNKKDKTKKNNTKKIEKPIETFTSSQVTNDPNLNIYASNLKNAEKNLNKTNLPFKPFNEESSNQAYVRLDVSGNYKNIPDRKRKISKKLTKK